MKPPLVVSLAWGDRYVRAAEKLEESCHTFGLPVSIQFRDLPPKHPEEAKRMKPELLLRALVEDHGPVMWIDADSEVVAPLVFPDGIDDCDMAAFRTNLWESTVLFCNRTPATFRTLDAWGARLMGDTWKYDSEVLTRVIDDVKPKMLTLSPALCWTEVFLRDVYPDTKPQIVHQAFLSSKRIGR